MTGVAVMPCTTTDRTTAKATVDHSSRRWGKLACPVAYAS
jgi:hypothetical protein